jgi:hypothetical protein
MATSTKKEYDLANSSKSQQPFPFPQISFEDNNEGSPWKNLMSNVIGNTPSVKNIV